MRVGEYASALGSIEQQKRLDVIANNIANANSPGYKKDNVYFSDFLGEITYTSMNQGPIHDTGNRMDIALSGNGFIRVQTDKGVQYTRAGNLTVDSSKNLVNQDGYQVLAKNGPIRVESTANLRIDETGQVFDGNIRLNSLDIVQFPPETILRKTRNGCFEPATSGTEPIPATNCTVQQGSLEGANFNPVEEMVKMIDTMRNFEAYQKTLQTFDKNLDGQVISKMSE